jgi:hypothetical protein
MSSGGQGQRSMKGFAKAYTSSNMHKQSLLKKKASKLYRAGMPKQPLKG